MPISIEEFNNPKSSWNMEIEYKRIIELLKNNKDKAYSILDLQIELKTKYDTIQSVIRRLRRENLIDWRWYKLEGRKMLYYHWKIEDKNG